MLKASALFYALLPSCGLLFLGWPGVADLVMDVLCGRVRGFPCLLVCAGGCGGCAFDGEFDPGSGRTLAACLTHASRAERPFGVLERRTGE